MASVALFRIAALGPREKQVSSWFSGNLCKAVVSLTQNCARPVSKAHFCNHQNLIPADSGRTSQQCALLEKIAFEVERRRPTDRSTDPVARAISFCLKDAKSIDDVNAVLCHLHFTSYVYTTIIQKLGQWGKHDVVFLLFQWLLSGNEVPDVCVCNSVLGITKAIGDFKYFKYTLEQMQKNDIQPDLVTFNSMIECYERQGFHSEAIQAFWELTSKGLRPNHATFRSILWNSISSSDVFGALRTYRLTRTILHNAEMNDSAEELRKVVSEFFMKVISAAIVSDKGPDNVIRLFEIAEASNLELSPQQYEHILWNCGSRKKDFVIAKYVLALRRKHRSPCNVRLYNHVMRLMGKEKKWWAALELFENMTNGGPHPNAESYFIIRSHFNILLAASRKRGTSRWNVLLLEKMDAHGIPPDQFAWDISLVACATSADPKSAVFILQRMIQKGYELNVLSYGALLSTLEKAGLTEKAELVWEHMKRSNVKPNINAYTIMVSVYGAAQEHEKLQRLLDEMHESNVEFTPITYNALITVCAKTGDAKGALTWMKQLMADGFSPDSISYSQLVIALCRAGQVRLAIDMYMKGRVLCVGFSRVAYESLVGACKSDNIEAEILHNVTESKLQNHECSGIIWEPEHVAKQYKLVLNETSINCCVGLLLAR